MKECPVAIGEILADKYRVERVLGFGGMGAVVAAWHLELEQLVAMKFLLPELSENEEAAERFRREARAAVKIKSEHVARVLDVGTMRGGVPFMVMEYMDGHDLAIELEKRGSLPVVEAVGHVVQACEAIAEAHAVGIIHRDLKPANLFLTKRSDGSTLIKVLDFGISKSVFGGVSSDMSLTRTSAIVGSPLYMAPEQLESAKDVDPRADIWSLGVILYELLSGQVPFLGDTIPQLVRAVLAADRLPLSQVVPGVPRGMEEIIGRCLCQRKEQRFANVAELTQALVEFTPDKSVMSAERVSRLLDVPMPDSLPYAVRGLDKSPSEELPQSSVKLSGAGEPVEGAAGTLASWGKTDPSMAEPVPSRSGPRGGIGLYAAAAVVVLGGVGAVLTTRSPPGEPASASAVAAPRNAADKGLPVAPRTAVPVIGERPREVRVDPVREPAVTPIPEPEPSALPSASTGTGSQPSDVAVRPKRPRKQRQSAKPVKPKASQEWTDFGGRR